jgi:2-C-methyl-D-erythritol 4-phosphate cytidylyltransferase/2-C-methyl-D-erythritol 2,4-cyclodiphosphate synthase
LSYISLIILSAGESSRFNNNTKKQWLRVESSPLWKYVADRLNFFFNFTEIIITANKNDIRLYEKLSDYKIVSGGSSRQESLKNAVNEATGEYVLVTDVARACVTKKMILDLIENRDGFECVVPFLKVVDTVVYQNETIDRNDVKLIQTPQLSKKDFLIKALNSNIEFTDDSSAIKHIGGEVNYIQGDIQAKKITFIEDLDGLKCLKKPNQYVLSGNGFDVHQFEENKTMFLCGVEIDVDYGFKAHSDGDVAIHSIIDSLLGAAGYGDIGEFFPDTDEKYKNIDSKVLLQEVINVLNYTGFKIINIDVTIIAQKPKLMKYKNKMIKSIKSLTNCNNINIKATTSEKLGFTGRGEGVAVISNANIIQKEWYENFNS